MADDPKLVDGLHARAIPGHFFDPDDSRILGWVDEAQAEGERVIKEDPGYEKIDQAQDYVIGSQIVKGPDRPSHVPSFVINQVRKAARTHVSALTDVRPLFSFKTANQAFEPSGNLLNNLTVAWWINSYADLALADAIKYALTAGSGDLLIEYDPYRRGGDIEMTARDPRDTIPIRPSRSRSLQDWEGLILLEAYSPNKAAGKFPDFKHTIFQEAAAGPGSSLFTRFRRLVKMVTPSSTLDGLKKGSQRGSNVVPEIVVRRVYLTDHSINMTGEPKLMGTPGTNWSYIVAPGKPLYPRKRLIICTQKTILYDGPNQYWHGMYPVARLKLESWPWQFLGSSLFSDLLPIQDALNSIVNEIFKVLYQHTQPGIIADQNAMPESQLKRLDTSKPGWKAKIKATMGEGFKTVAGPVLPPWIMDFMKTLFQKFDELSEIANLQALMQLRQMPGAETIEKYAEALTPGIRLEGRNVEFALREVAEMFKANVFQFYSTARRVLLLGDAGRTLQDFDYDPNNLVPALQEGDPAYTPELDVSKPREERAQFFHKLFTFFVAPNSILALHSQQQQLKFLQLSRQGYLDFWTLLETMEVPNVGAPPPMPLPAIGWKPGKMDPVTGVPETPPLEVRVPQTITERLQAQAALQIGMTASPAGRKASGQAAPELKQKSDGSTTITES